MANSLAAKKLKRAFWTAAVAALLFAGFLLGTLWYAVHYGATNGEQSWQLSFALLYNGPLIILNEVSHHALLGDHGLLGSDQDTSQKTMIMVDLISAVLDALPVFVAVFLFSFVWEFILKTDYENKH
jgi:hypothetical protein